MPAATAIRRSSTVRWKIRPSSEPNPAAIWAVGPSYGYSRSDQLDQRNTRPYFSSFLMKRLDGGVGAVAFRFRGQLIYDETADEAAYRGQ